MLTKSRWRLTKASEGVGGLGDRMVEDDSDTRRDHGGGIADTLLQLCLTVWASTTIRKFGGFGPKNLGWSLGRHMVSLGSLCQGEVFS